MSKKLCDEYRKESYGTTLPNKQKSFSLPDQSMCIFKKMAYISKLYHKSHWFLYFPIIWNTIAIEIKGKNISK